MGGAGESSTLIIHHHYRLAICICHVQFKIETRRDKFLDLKSVRFEAWANIGPVICLILLR